MVIVAEGGLTCNGLYAGVGTSASNIGPGSPALRYNRITNTYDNAASNPSVLASTVPSISDTGHYAVYGTAYAGSAYTSIDTNSSPDIYIKDLKTGAASQLLSRNTFYAHGNCNYGGVISADGSVVAARCIDTSNTNFKFLPTEGNSAIYDAFSFQTGY